MITPAFDRADQRAFVVLGLARSGLSTVKALLHTDVRVIGWDENATARDAALALGISVMPLSDIDWSNVQALVVSPGVPLYFPVPSPWAVAARAAGVVITGDIDLFARARGSLPAHKVIGITGTNGKSTTTALVAHILTEAGVPNRMGGNIGLPILDQEPLPAGGVYVLELSSFQIDLVSMLACDVAVLTNITPDHLDRHGDLQGYAAAKSRLFELQDADAVAVVSIDDELCRAIYAIAPVGRVAISVKSVLTRGVCVVAGIMTVDNSRVATQADWPSLQGPHNAQNAAAAVAAVLAVGVPRDKATAALKNFGGLEHRMERIATVNGVLYVNDSKATNADSTAPALAAYPGIHWIVGGRRKTDELDVCLPYLKNVQAAYLIGEAAAVFAGILSPHVPVVMCGTLDVAVQKAAAAGRDGEVVLLSPACASQDQFKDYEERGNLFRALVGALT